MNDFGRSDDPQVQAQLDRLAALSVPQGRLGLETITAMMERLGNPHRRLPPVFHVAGTNGKGSTCAFLRAMLEAEGNRVHVTTSPHLVRYNERIRIAGQLISDEELASTLKEILDTCEDLGPSFFEVTIAAAFLAFSRHPADACVVEVGLGGRFDATNVLEPEVLAACGIAALDLDHERFLLAPEEGVPKQPMARIAFEKAGIAKKGVPLVTIEQPDLEMRAISAVADAVCAPVMLAEPLEGFELGLTGKHQLINAALAIAMLRAQSRLQVSASAIRSGLECASWPARMQKLSPGPLVGDRQVWLDGGHNPSAGLAIAGNFQEPIHLILGMLDNKDPAAITGPLGDRMRTLTIVPVPGHDSHPVEAFGPEARAAVNVEEALFNIPSDDHTILIAGSLYLAGEVLRLNDEIPD
ncbi:bifunctional folylpolyglutamate synthase/dihydrofolate synthase [Erythrobacter sp. HA6-11]